MKTNMVIFLWLFFSVKPVFSKIKMSDFSSSIQVDLCGEEVCLAWETQLVLTTDYFSIERSADAQSFVAIDTLQIAGNGNLSSSYSGTDHDPINGTSYYRIRQVDVNGDYVFFNTIPVTKETAPQHTLIMYPNPASDYLEIQLPNFKEIAVLVVLDITGKSALSQLIYSADKTAEISVEDLPSGCYFVQLTSHGKLWCKKLIVE